MAEIYDSGENCVALDVSLLNRLPIEIKKETMYIGSVVLYRALRKSWGKSCQFLPQTSRLG